MNISEKPQWENNISMLARQQKVEGGRDGAANIQAQQLANRTRFLKQSVEAYSTLIKSGELPYSNEDEAKAAIVAGKIAENALFPFALKARAYGLKSLKILTGCLFQPASGCLTARVFPWWFSPVMMIRQARRLDCH
jgi:hypothetical protein